jgi:hypothetical protein
MNIYDTESVDVTTRFFEEVVHHDTVPKFGVVVFEFGMGCEFDPIIFYNILEALSPLSSTRDSCLAQVTLLVDNTFNLYNGVTNFL